MDQNTKPNFLRSAAVGLAILVVAFVLARLPGLFDLPVTRLLNSLTNRDKTLDRASYAFYWYLSLNSVLLMSLVWYCWFRSDDIRIRGRLLAGTVAALVAAIISRFFQYTLPTHSRPIYDQALAFQKPSTLETVKLNTWNSFPSDHSTLLAGLVTILWIVKAPFRQVLLVLMVVVETARVYMGAHYPSDLIGGAGLAICVVSLSQSELILRFGRWVASLEARNRALFYGFGYYLCYQMVTYFGDLRSFAAIFLSFGHWL